MSDRINPAPFLCALLAAMALCALTVCVRPRPASRSLPARSVSPRSPAEAALRQAAHFRTQAILAASSRGDDLEAWDPTAAADVYREEWRLQDLAADPEGNLHEARRWAQEAARLAHTPAEAYAAAEIQVLLDHEMGEHDAELRRTKSLLALAPGSARARMAWRRAQECQRRRGGG